MKNGSTESATGGFAAWIVAATLAVMFMGSTLLTPLYVLYQQAFGFSEVTLTLLYAVYVLGNLSALLFFGRIADQIGRRRVTVPVVLLAGISTLLFLFACGEAWLFCGRVLSGFAIGLASSAGTAWIAELYPGPGKGRASVMASSANLAGLSVGSLLTGLLAQYAPWPLHLSYIVYLAVLGAVGLLVARAPETIDPMPIADASMRPRLGVPGEIRAAFVAPAVTAFGTFALLGFYAALAPTLLTESLHVASHAVAGAVVFELFLVATIANVATQAIESRAAMLGGLALLPPCVALLVLAQSSGSMTVLLAGTTLTGISAALGYRGSLQVVNRIAPADRRAEVVSSYLIACYVGNSLPVIGVGVVATVVDPLTASIVFAVIIAALALAAFATGIKYAPKD